MRLLIEVFVGELRRILIDELIHYLVGGLTARDTQMILLGFILAILFMQIFG